MVTAPGKPTTPRNRTVPLVMLPLPSRLTVTTTWNAPLAFKPVMGGTSLAGVRYKKVETVSALADAASANASTAKTDAVKPTVLFIAFPFPFIVRA